MTDKISNASKKAFAKKKNCRVKKEYPFPIVRTPGLQDFQKDPNWECVEGSLQENCVLVYDDASIKLLYIHGFYGKGTKSKYAPRICFKHENDNKDDQPGPSGIKPKVDVIEIDEGSDDDEEEEEDNSEVKSKDVEEIVLSDSSMSETEKDFFPLKKIDIPEELVEKENLQLTFEEAFFLSYGLGCLVVKDKKNQYISLPRLWSLFCELRPHGNFPYMYAAYHHFRSKGWVVKSGIKFGTHFVLYKDGPAFYHSTYSVIVKPVNFNVSKKTTTEKPMTYAQLMALSRLSSNANKTLLFVYVTKPTTVTESQMSSPSCISLFKIQALNLTRWVPELSIRD